MRVTSTLFVILTSFALVGCAGEPALCENVHTGQKFDAREHRTSYILRETQVSHYRYYTDGKAHDITPSMKDDWECTTGDLWAKDSKPVDK